MDGRGWTSSSAVDEIDDLCSLPILESISSLSRSFRPPETDLERGSDDER